MVIKGEKKSVNNPRKKTRVADLSNSGYWGKHDRAVKIEEGGVNYWSTLFTFVFFFSFL